MINKKIIKVVVVGTIYMALCFIFSYISFGPIQLRVSELLCLLAIENPIYIIGISIGCFISNLLLSPLGLADAIIGTLASVIGCLIGYLFRKIKIKDFPLLSTITISLVNGIMIALEMNYILDNSNIFIYSFIEIFISELIILVFIGYPIYKKLLNLEKQ